MDPALDRSRDEINQNYSSLFTFDFLFDETDNEKKTLGLNLGESEGESGKLQSLKLSPEVNLNVKPWKPTSSNQQPFYYSSSNLSESLQHAAYVPKFNTPGPGGN